MKSLKRIKKQLHSGKFEFTRHAFKRAVQRNISDFEIMEAGGKSKIIENYPDDKYGPSCLLLGFTHAGRALHIQVSRAESEVLKIITAYEPDSSEWTEGYSERR